MSVTIERKKPDCNVLPKGWQREAEVLRKTGISAGKVDVYYYSKGFDSTAPVRHFGNSQDIPTFSSKRSKPIEPPHITIHRSSGSLKRKLPFERATCVSPTGTDLTPTLRQHLEFSRGMRTDVSLVPPIRQTASIFKQPVTVHKMQEGKVKNDLKHGTQDKPKQLFWEKRLEGLRSCDITGLEFGPFELPRGIKPVGPMVTEQTLLQSVATALHVSSQPVTGQTASKAALNANSGVFLNPDQPLMQSVTVTEDDIRRQEDRVSLARRRLQEALKT